MQITIERFNGGTTYAEFHERIMTGGGIMRDLLEASDRTLGEAAVDVTPFSRLAKPMRVLVLSEDWCGDCTDNLPILNWIAEESGKLEVRIVPRDENLDIADRYLNRGEFRSIPLILFLDENLQVVGHLIERPDSVTELRLRKRQEIYAEHPEFGTPQTPPSELPEAVRDARLKAELAARAGTRPFAIQEVVRELSAIVERL